MHQQKKQKGFTLIELLAVIAIISFLAAATILVLSQTRQKSRDGNRVANVKQIISALEMFYTDCYMYPIESSAIVIDETQSLFTGTASDCGNKTGSGGANGGFGTTPSGTILVGEFQPAPLPPDGTCTDANGSNRYTYTSATGNGYTLTFCLGQSVSGFVAGVNSITR